MKSKIVWRASLSKKWTKSVCRQMSLTLDLRIIVGEATSCVKVLGRSEGKSTKKKKGRIAKKRGAQRSKSAKN